MSWWYKIKLWFNNAMTFVYVFFAVFIFLTVIAVGLAFVQTLSDHLVDQHKKNEKYERMQYVKDSLEVESLKQKLKKP